MGSLKRKLERDWERMKGRWLVVHPPREVMSGLEAFTAEHITEGHDFVVMTSFCGASIVVRCRDCNNDGAVARRLVEARLKAEAEEKGGSYTQRHKFLRMFGWCAPRLS